MFSFIINFIGRIIFTLICLYGGKLLWNKYKNRNKKEEYIPKSYEVGRAYADVVTLDGHTHTREFRGRAYWNTGYSSEYLNTLETVRAEDRVMNWIKESGKKNIFVIDWYTSIPLPQVKVVNVRYEKYQVKV